MTKQSIRRKLTYSMLCFYFLFFSCGDVKCKDKLPASGSSLRNFDISDRIPIINKEITSLEKDKNKDSSVRLGDLYEQLANIYLEKENLESAFININKAFSYGRNTPYLNYIAGLVYANKGVNSNSKDDIDKAEKYYRQAIGMQDKYDEAWYALAVLLFFQKKEREEPIKIMEQLYIRSKNNYRARFALGRFYYESGRTNDALNVYIELQIDINNNPDSEIIQEFRKSCEDNIRKIRNEIEANQ